jgi:hypothetical protein
MAGAELDASGVRPDTLTLHGGRGGEICGADVVQDWNDTGGALFGPRGDPSGVGPELDRFWALAAELAELAERTQQELGPGHEVLHQTPQGAWRWVLPPASRPRR